MTAAIALWLTFFVFIVVFYFLAATPKRRRWIRWAKTRGMLLAIGHSAADEATTAEAAEAGAVLCTHLGNAVPHLLPKFDNPLIARLAEDRLTATFIADGIHVPFTALKVMLRAKGPSRSVLVTDATAAAAAPPGLHRFAGMAIDRTAEGRVCLPGSGTLAGSALTLDQAVRNLVTRRLAPSAEAIRSPPPTPPRCWPPPWRHTASACRKPWFAGLRAAAATRAAGWHGVTPRATNARPAAPWKCAWAKPFVYLSGVGRPGAKTVQSARPRAQNGHFLASRRRSVSVTVTLGNGNNSATFSTVDTLISGTGNDAIDFTGTLANASIDLGGGNDTLTFGNFANTATVANPRPSPAAPATTPSRWPAR